MLQLLLLLCYVLFIVVVSSCWPYEFAVLHCVTVSWSLVNKWLWLPCLADADIIFLSCGFFYLLISSPILSRRRLDVYHTSTHGVALVWI